MRKRTVTVRSPAELTCSLRDDELYVSFVSEKLPSLAKYSPGSQTNRIREMNILHGGMRK